MERRAGEIIDGRREKIRRKGDLCVRTYESSSVGSMGEHQRKKERKKKCFKIKIFKEKMKRCLKKTEIAYVP